MSSHAKFEDDIFMSFESVRDLEIISKEMSADIVKSAE